MAKLPTPSEGILLTHFIVSDDVERARRFYTDVLGGETVFHGDSSKGEPSIIALANGWVTINVGGGPTPDKPTVTLQAPRDPDHVTSFLNIRVADIEAVYREWSARVARPTAHLRCAVLSIPLTTTAGSAVPGRTWSWCWPRASSMAGSSSRASQQAPTVLFRHLSAGTPGCGREAVPRARCAGRLRRPHAGTTVPRSVYLV